MSIKVMAENVSALRRSQRRGPVTAVPVPIHWSRVPCAMLRSLLYTRLYSWYLSRNSKLVFMAPCALAHNQERVGGGRIHEWTGACAQACTHEKHAHVHAHMYQRVSRTQCQSLSRIHCPGVSSHMVSRCVPPSHLHHRRHRPQRLRLRLCRHQLRRQCRIHISNAIMITHVYRIAHIYSYVCTTVCAHVNAHVYAQFKCNYFHAYTSLYMSTRMSTHVWTGFDDMCIGLYAHT